MDYYSRELPDGQDHPGRLAVKSNSTAVGALLKIGRLAGISTLKLGHVLLNVANQSLATTPLRNKIQSCQFACVTSNQAAKSGPTKGPPSLINVEEADCRFTVGQRDHSHAKVPPSP